MMLDGLFGQLVSNILLVDLGFAWRRPLPLLGRFIVELQPADLLSGHQPQQSF